MLLKYYTPVCLTSRKLQQTWWFYKLLDSEVDFVLLAELFPFGFVMVLLQMSSCDLTDPMFNLKLNDK